MKPEHRLIINRAHEMNIAPSELASELLERDLLEHCVTFLKKQKATFSSLSEGAQDAAIRELESIVRASVKTAVTIIAGKGTVAIPVTLKSITVDKGLKVVADVDSQTPHRHELVDAAQNLCLLVLAPYQYSEGTDSVKGERDQQDLPLGTDTQAAPVVDTNVTPYDLSYAHVVNGGEISPNAIAKAAGVKRKESGDLLLQLQENGVISQPDDDGKRTLLIQPAASIAPKVDTQAVTTDDGQYADACALVLREMKVSVSFLKAELAVDEDTAEALIKRMEAEGVVSEENDMGGRSVFN